MSLPRKITDLDAKICGIIHKLDQSVSMSARDLQKVTLSVVDQVLLLDPSKLSASEAEQGYRLVKIDDEIVSFNDVKNQTKSSDPLFKVMYRSDWHVADPVICIQCVMIADPRFGDLMS